MKEKHFSLQHRTTCRICGSDKGIRRMLHWKNIPLAANLTDKINPNEEKYNLDVYYCEECGHVQLLDVIDSGIYEDYLYTPSYSSEYNEYLDSFTKNLVEKYGKGNVMEVGSSDGELLQYFKKYGCDVTGFEPSGNLAKLSAETRGIPVINDYFSAKTAEKVYQKLDSVDYVVVRHVMEHLDDLNAIVDAFVKILNDNGTLVIEVPYLYNILTEKQFYAFFHEHLSYFSVTALNNLLSRHGFRIYDVHTNKLEGGSIVVYATRNSSVVADESVERFLNKEKDTLSSDNITSFFAGIQSSVQKTQRFILDAVKSGQTLAGWGAGQRGVMLMNICGFSSDEIAFVIDVNQCQ